MSKNKDKDQFKKEFKKRLYKFVLKLIKFIDKLPNNNVGQAASSKKDFTNFFNHSLKSANESKLWVALLRDSGRAKPDDAKWLLDELTEIANIFASSILTLKGKR